MKIHLRHKLGLGLVAVLLALAFNVSQAQTSLPSIAPPVIQPEAGKTYFTRVTFFYEKGVHQATNFSRGQSWPINTEVRVTRITDSRGGRIELERVDTNEKVTISNIPKHTNIGVQELASRMLADRKTPIEKLPENFQSAIKAGQLRMGMSKEIAIMARGYPPATHTPSLDADRWTYQVNRFAVHTIVFNNGVISEGRDL